MKNVLELHDCSIQYSLATKIRQILGWPLLCLFFSGVATCPSVGGMG